MNPADTPSRPNATARPFRPAALETGVRGMALVAASLILNAAAPVPASVPVAAAPACVIEVQGDSLAYGQDTVSGQTRPPINGAVQTRSTRPFPEYLGGLLGRGYTVVNHGFPGDRTTDGLRRWGTAPGVRIGVLLFGTNDALNLGGAPDGAVPPARYAAQLGRLADRYRQAGARVVLLIPPPLADQNMDRQLQPHRAAALRVARERSFAVVALTRAETGWTDGVHLDSATNVRLARKLLPLVRSCRP